MKNKTIGLGLSRHPKDKPTDRQTAVPLVFEHFGRWGEKVLKYLDDLSHISRDKSGQKNPANFKLFWRRLSVELQKM